MCSPLVLKTLAVHECSINPSEILLFIRVTRAYMLTLLPRWREVLQGQVRPKFFPIDIFF
ncbi:hypothetical protein Pcar_3290 [Syntrophotalea carbinolica DSM 2380]|uniref:Uncharacterized protein n=1 Tax=Syntrophotalea carbinolica (strain DSM 2380 / NBRC 103641 / GraBd1) TaxID=338963 RepID=Q0C6M8_SYNC1|nr:hypothetical protein Pcar_3290 [Syntrophotalea carbinolica DSM 2380]